MDEGLMDKGLYERLVEDVLDNIKLKGIDVAKKNYEKICSNYGVIYKNNRLEKKNEK